MILNPILKNLLSQQQLIEKLCTPATCDAS